MAISLGVKIDDQDIRAQVEDGTVAYVDALKRCQTRVTHRKLDLTHDNEGAGMFKQESRIALGATCQTVSTKAVDSTRCVKSWNPCAFETAKAGQILEIQDSLADHVGERADNDDLATAKQRDLRPENQGLSGLLLL